MAFAPHPTGQSSKRISWLPAFLLFCRLLQSQAAASAVQGWFKALDTSGTVNQAKVCFYENRRKCIVKCKCDSFPIVSQFCLPKIQVFRQKPVPSAFFCMFTAVCTVYTVLYSKVQ